jgi:hypothetical protein
MHLRSLLYRIRLRFLERGGRPGEVLQSVTAGIFYR